MTENLKKAKMKILDELKNQKLKEQNGFDEKFNIAIDALKPFAEFAKASSFDKLPDDIPMTQGSAFARRQVTAGDFKRAKLALEQLTNRS